MINDLTDEIFWVVTVGLCILFILRLLSPPPGESARARDIARLSPRRRARRQARRKARTVE